MNKDEVETMHRLLNKLESADVRIYKLEANIRQLRSTMRHIHKNAENASLLTRKELAEKVLYIYHLSMIHDIGMEDESEES